MTDTGAISCSVRGFAVAKGARTILVAGFEEIALATAFKRDEITTDLLCVEIELANGESLVLNEDMAGFEPWLTSLEALPGADPEWRDKVIQPPFARNPTVLFARPNQGQK